MNASAQAWPRLTMVSEPLIWMELACWLCRLQPARNKSPRQERIAEMKNHFFLHHFFLLVMSSFLEKKFWRE